MANPSTQAEVGKQGETREADDFTSLLKQSFKPRTERAATEVENAVTTLVREALSGETVICHFHGSGFDIRTGAVVCPPASDPIASFPVSVDGGCILVDGIPAQVRVGYTGLRDNG